MRCHECGERWQGIGACAGAGARAGARAGAGACSGAVGDAGADLRLLSSPLFNHIEIKTYLYDSHVNLKCLQMA